MLSFADDDDQTEYRAIAYTYEFLLAIAICALILNIALLVRINFGNLLLTKLSTRPYIVSLIFFFAMIIEFTCICILKNITYKDDP